MSHSPIFKVNRLSHKNQIEDIYVFSGLEENEDLNDLNDLFKQEPGNKVFSNMFDKDELHYIKTNKIKVHFVNETIYIDDNIGIIKLKIFEAIEREASINELYLFGLNHELLNPITVYQKLTQYSKLPLTKPRLNQLLLNLYDENGELIRFENKVQYVFDDILELKLNETSYLVSKPLGRQNIFKEYPFISNPYLAIENDSLLDSSDKENVSLNNNLLLESGDIFKNNIYLCLARDIFEDMEENKDSDMKIVSKTYFPSLYYDHIENIESLDDNKKKLMNLTLETLTPDTKKNLSNIDLFYRIYNNHSSSNKFSQIPKQTGITFFKAIMHPEFKIKIPIETIFKLIHATENVPLIKYNPYLRQEKLYRLYAPKLSTHGQNIPYLEKALINRLMKTIGKNKSVAMYTVIQYNDVVLTVICEFYEDATIMIYPFVDFETPFMLTQVDEIIRLAINPLIEEIKPFFEQSGLELPLFTSVQNQNVEVREVKFQMVYNIKKSFDIQKKIACISSIFTIESKDYKQNIRLRFKRVTNYNKRDSQEAFVIEKLEQGYDKDEIIRELTQQFSDLDEDSAIELVSKIFSELQMIGENKKPTLINPGFQTFMDVNTVNSNLTVIVNGINNINYFKTIPIYIDSIVRITQDVESCGIDPKQISKLCSGKKELNDIEFKEIIPEKYEPESDKYESDKYESDYEMKNDWFGISFEDMSEEEKTGGKKSRRNYKRSNKITKKHRY